MVTDRQFVDRWWPTVTEEFKLKLTNQLTQTGYRAMVNVERVRITDIIERGQ